MKKYKKQILIGLFLILIGIFIHPRKVIYEPKISGKVTDERGNPVVKATVTRIGDRYFKNEEFGYEESKERKTSQAFRFYKVNGSWQDQKMTVLMTLKKGVSLQKRQEPPRMGTPRVDVVERPTACLERQQKTCEYKQKKSNI